MLVDEALAENRIHRLARMLHCAFEIYIRLGRFLAAPNQGLDP